MSEELSDYKDTIRKLYELGILQTIKRVADKMFTGEQTLRIIWNEGGVRSVFEDQSRKLK